MVWRHADKDGRNGQELNDKFHGAEENNLEEVMNRVEDGE